MLGIVQMLNSEFILFSSVIPKLASWGCGLNFKIKVWVCIGIMFLKVTNEWFIFTSKNFREIVAGRKIAQEQECTCITGPWLDTYPAKGHERGLLPGPPPPLRKPST